MTLNEIVGWVGQAAIRALGEVPHAADTVHDRDSTVNRDPALRA